MNADLAILRGRKLLAAALHPLCWKPLALGVAPSVEHFGLLRSLSVAGVLDVGASRGQFSLACRICLPGTPIVAFEPIPEEARTFRAVHAGAHGVTLIESALGERAGEATLHLSARSDSSSVLPIGRGQVEIYPSTAEVGQITVAMARLDDLAEHWRGRAGQLLKLDVQGFELQVLRGAPGTLSSCSY